MIESFLFRLLWALFLVFSQVLVFNHIHFMGYAIPLVYIYLILQFPKGSARWQVLLWGFSVGFVIDIFSNTPGVTSSCMTALAMLQPFLLKIFASSVSDDEVWTPGAEVMRWGSFCRYVVVAVLFYVSLFFTIEAFSFSNWKELLFNIGGSFVMTTLFVLVIERIRISKKA